MNFRRTVGALDEAGETLVETLMTVLVMGIVFVAVYAGFATTIGISQIHRYQATEQTIARDFSEYVQYNTGFGYHACGQPADYNNDVSSFESAYALPDGSHPLTTGDYSLTIDSIAYWNGSSTATFGSTCLADSGVQRFAFTVSTPKDSRASVSLQVVKRK